MTKRLLQTVGAEIFVEFYYDFKNCALNAMAKQTLAQKLLNNNSRASVFNGQLTRINAAIRIIQQGLAKDAMNIIRNSNHVPDVTKKIADEFYNGVRKL